jgi:hypothetical protein
MALAAAVAAPGAARVGLGASAEDALEPAGGPLAVAWAGSVAACSRLELSVASSGRWQTQKCIVSLQGVKLQYQMCL